MKYFKQIATVIIISIILILIIVLGCEPVSVSVNSNGDVAFTRSEGVFFVNINDKKLTSVVWDEDNSFLPIIVRWAPDNNTLAFTSKEDENAAITSLLITNKNGEGDPKEIYSTDKIITQIEWSPDGKYITVAQQGDDADMLVADLVLVNVETGDNSVILVNTGDVHQWYDTNTIAFMKINEKNPDTSNPNIYKAKLELYDVPTKKIKKSILPTIVGKSGSIDCNAKENQILFTAVDINESAETYPKNKRENQTIAYIYDASAHTVQKLSKDYIYFVKYSFDGMYTLVKILNKTTNKVDLAYIDIKTKKMTVLESDVLHQISNVAVYPTWLDKKNVLYMREIHTYGSNGKSIQLMSVNIDTLKKSNQQILIDNFLHQLQVEKGGYK